MSPRLLAVVGLTLAALTATAVAQQQPDYKAAAQHYKAAETAMTASLQRTTLEDVSAAIH